MLLTECTACGVRGVWDRAAFGVCGVKRTCCAECRLYIVCRVWPVQRVSCYAGHSTPVVFSNTVSVLCDRVW